MILLITDPAPDHIIINGKDEGSSDQFNKTFTAGYYDIDITKVGYQDWHRSIFVEAQKLAAFKNITLFSATPKISDLVDQAKIDFLNTPNSYLAENSPDDLTFNQYEMWVNGNLLTRFSTPINSPIWYPDNDHIIYQTGNEIRVIERSGHNDLLLVKLGSTNPTKFTIGNKGRELYYLDGSVYKQAVIR
jgi:hypothetical protein